MSLDELISNYDALLAGFGNVMLDEVTDIAQDGLVFIDRRITRQGLNSNNTPFPDYSVGYKLEKKRAGKYRGIVDLTFTGQMWRNIKIVGKFQNGTMTTVRVGASDAVTQAKMDNNADLRGDFMNLSEQELQALIADSQERLLGTITTALE